MKKLLLLVAAFATVFVNAASFDWKLQTGAGYEGFSVYALTGTTSSDVLSVFASSDVDSWTDPVAGFSAFQVTGNNSRSGATGKSDGVTADQELVFVIIGSSIAEGNQFWVMNEYSIPGSAIYEPPATGTALTMKMADLGVAGTGTFTSTAVPEPASAMLALAGVAMLIRRRKYATR